ncbi:uncharacterized protein THITE_2145448 [Thermothielavioides terrestris NRRL 8126]|uniref:Uncharacterized protein n=1 Tax=Thermothielavioides terrestris (strain ATCC 38088 / NRRL 8126) TaxID=578455 RepID=G2R8P7_THETT|nr:uncharacterized protein THITE_2145448 [Thermothielavioides terrestris NRRL 8126]AEO68263.1 hypothetical protein THITE_2145448 [Thermothielavioides terrestris NRRL 8126]
MAGVAAAALAAPTQPLKISLTRLPNPAPEGSPHPALARSQHTLTVLPASNKAFIFGGVDASGALCPPGIHNLTLPPSSQNAPTSLAAAAAAEAAHATAYTCYPPFPLRDASTGETLVPAPRAAHSACAWRGRYLLVHGGRDSGGGQPVREGNVLWRWDGEALSWAKLRGDSQLGRAMAPRYGHWLFGDEGQGFLVAVGGHGGDGDGVGDGIERELWMYDFGTMVWTALPSAPVRPVAAAYAGGRVYVISERADGCRSGCAVHYLDLRESPVEREKPGALVWRSVSFPANPLAPGPRPRSGGALVPLTTGHGREYLVYLFGRSAGGAPLEELHSDIWTLQLPSWRRSAAAAKDKVLEKLPGGESGEFQWAEAEIVPTEQMTEKGRKVHPGPRAFFGADACCAGQGVVLWGGVNADGGTEGDGWLLRLAYGYADNGRFE